MDIVEKQTQFTCKVGKQLINIIIKSNDLKQKLLRKVYHFCILL